MTRNKIIFITVGALIILYLISSLFSTKPPAGGARSGIPGVQDILELKKLGFSESEIQTELGKHPSLPLLSASDEKCLASQGFSSGLIELIKSKAPRPLLTNEEVLAMSKRPLKELLEKCNVSECRFKNDPASLLAFSKNKKIPKTFVYVVRGTPLKFDDLSTLAKAGVPAGEMELLLRYLGCEKTALSPSEALDWLHQGIPQPVITLIKSGSAKTLSTQTSSATKPVPSGKVFYSHPLELFSLLYPENWKRINNIEEANVTYSFTPETEKNSSDDLEIFATAMVISIGADSILEKSSSVDALKKMLPLIRQDEPEMNPVGEIKPARLGKEDAASLTFQGKMTKKTGEFSAEFYFCLKGKKALLFMTAAPVKRYSEYKNIFEDIVKSLEFLPDKTPERQEKMYTVEELATRYKESVVSVVTQYKNGNGGFGTGFIISEDGYILTNHHVVWDTETKAPGINFTAEWDDSTKIPKQNLELIDCRFQSNNSPYMDNYGVDVAILKLPGGKKYKPIPLTPLSEVKLGDAIMTLGYPARTLMQGLSLVITSGVVTRFNRDPLNESVSSIYIDASITHGNSGGPCVSLTTGGVIGLNTFGQDIVTDPSQQVNNNLIAYKGVLPILQAFREFPLETRISAERRNTLDSMDYADIAIRSMEDMAPKAASRIIQKALQTSRGDSAEILYLAGQIKIASIDSTEDKTSVNEAIQLLEKALQLKNDHLSARMLLSQIYEQSGDPVKAISEAGKAVENSPGNWMAYHNRARLNWVMKRNEEALKDIEEAKIKSQNVLPQPYLLSAQILYSMNRLDDGKKEYLKALEIHPDNIEARLGMAQYHVLKKNDVSALIEFDSIQKQYPSHPILLQNMASCYRRMGKADKAVELFIQSINRYQEFGITGPDALYFDLAQTIEEDKNDFKSSILYYTLYITLFEKAEYTAEIHRRLGRMMLEKTGLQSVARAHFLWALQYDDKDQESKSRFEQLQSVFMSIEDIQKMMELKYVPMTAAKIIAVNPLNFEVQSNIKTLLENFPPLLVRAMLESEKNYAEIKQKMTQQQGGNQNNTQEQQGNATARQQNPARGQALPAEFVGTWIGQLRINGTGVPVGQIQVQFSADGRFSSVSTMGNQNESDQGTVSIEQRVFVFNSDTGRSVRYMFQWNGQSLVFTIPGMGDIPFQKMNQ